MLTPLLLLLACQPSGPTPKVPPAPALAPAKPAKQEMSVVKPGSALHVSGASKVAESRGTTLWEYSWSFGSERGWMWVARVPAARAVLTVHPSAEVQVLSAFPSPREGEVLINGGFYDDGPMGLVVHQGKEHAPLTEVGGSGVVLWAESKGVHVVHRRDWSGEGSEALQSIDRLVDGGKSLVAERAEAPAAARAAIAVSSEHVYLVVLSTASPQDSPGADLGRHRDGSQEFSGLPLWAFADLLVWLGTEQALNMDGGISVEMRGLLEGQEYSLSGGPGTINALSLSASPER